MSVAARARGDASSKRRLRAWIRLLGATRAAEGALREFLRVEHGTTLPRFDVMAALHRRREGVTMSQLSRMLLVSNGNATALIDRLEQDGLVRRMPSPSDRRSILVALTPLGTSRFEALAAEHEAEVARLFAPLSDADLDRLADILRRLARHDPGTAREAVQDAGARAWTRPS
ncbi:MarR family winged helix-turn-helix transcriptional regulator [Salinarimonas sp.]|uniref:MarR family winged helix-turn-helix transcriptional regulator n=1 Tax=Salinarimonas sp. TaxID=2766526 RepID=UPI00391A106B